MRQLSAEKRASVDGGYGRKNVKMPHLWVGNGSFGDGTIRKWSGWDLNPGPSNADSMLLLLTLALGSTLDVSGSFLFSHPGPLWQKPPVRAE